MQKKQWSNALSLRNPTVEAVRMLTTATFGPRGLAGPEAALGVDAIVLEGGAVFAAGAEGAWAGDALVCC